MKKDSSDGAHAMARCLSDVSARLPDRDTVNFLSSEQNDELLNWDAEKYRQALNKSKAVVNG